MGDDEQISLYQIWDNTNWCKTLSQTQIPNTPKWLFLTNTKTKEPNTNQRTKGS